MWDGAQQLTMQALTIPRGVCLLAGGRYRQSGQSTTTVLKVAAAIDDADWAIVQSPFMGEKATTVSFSHELAIKDDELSYSETTVVDIYGTRIDHTDTNTLVRGN